MRVTRYHLALLAGSALVLAALLYFNRPVCTCELGHPDRTYQDNESAAEDCAVHGGE